MPWNCPGSQFHIWATGGKYCGRIQEASIRSEGGVETLFLLKSCDDNIETEVFLILASDFFPSSAAFSI